MQIGKAANGANWAASIGFAGLMDEPAFFDRMLEPDELQDVMVGDFRAFGVGAVSYPHLTLPTTPYV